MPLVTTKEMFKKAYEGHYAIGAFNVNNMEIVQGITEAAKELNAPLILQCSAGARKYAKHQYLVHLVQAAIEDTGLPIALHLDHGADFETCKSCIDGGFTSVMFDGSHYSFKENIEKNVIVGGATEIHLMEKHKRKMKKVKMMMKYQKKSIHSILRSRLLIA